MLGMVQLAPAQNAFLGTGGAYMGEKPFSDQTASLVDAEVLRIINESHDEAKRLLETHRGALDKLAEALLSHETLDEREILDVTGLTPPPPPQSRPRATGD